MDNMVTFSYAGPDVIIRLNPGARANLKELLELIDLDDFSMDPADRADLAETKLQIETAVGTPTS
jgi:hypothetical protein